jgi:hypothetical protein
MDPLIVYGIEEPTQQNPPEDGSSQRQQRAQRNYSTQILRPSAPVSPCLNAIDRARRARSSRIRQPGDVDPNAEDVFCDITPLLREKKTKSVTKKRQSEFESNDDDDEIPEMVLTEDEEEGDGEYEFVERGEGLEMHNGTVRRWYRGFRH